MRITVSIDDKKLKEVMKLTGEKSKSAAVNAAVEEMIRMAKVRHVVAMAREGRMDYGSTNEEVEAMWND